MFFRKLKRHFLPNLAQKKMHEKGSGLQRGFKKSNLCQLLHRNPKLTQDVRRAYL
jgi:hypothetical protein